MKQSEKVVDTSAGGIDQKRPFLDLLLSCSFTFFCTVSLFLGIFFFCCYINFDGINTLSFQKNVTHNNRQVAGTTWS